ncbi:hypothetical protein PENTCL1PPCAC_21441 [Pristionchus entomophagus]|uniref:CNH domain-containing protein n=1 Tax=Pristionchus entomophagus TaxID=358040 RepID=A0AAV5TYD0_9BILA|nr:hypothetical protein PENTCL1PPCAC_21441 [Pristionchus entomophagus]
MAIQNYPWPAFVIELTSPHQTQHAMLKRGRKEKSASTPCDFFLTTDTGKRIEVEINILEANSCCDYLVIYDGYLGGSVLANHTGEVRMVAYTTTSANIMRVRWEPKGGVNVQGLAVRQTIYSCICFMGFERRQNDCVAQQESISALQIHAFVILLIENKPTLLIDLKGHVIIADKNEAHLLLPRLTICFPLSWYLE